MSNATEAQGECTNATPEAEAHDPKRPIRNISAMKTPALRKRLQDAGLDVAPRANRARLIEAARAAGLWRYDGDQVPAKYKAKYGRTQSCDDDVATSLKDAVTGADGSCDLDAVRNVAIANDIDPKRWGHLNVGMQRMNLGNVLRAMVKRGEYVIVGTSEWNPEAA